MSDRQGLWGCVFVMVRMYLCLLLLLPHSSAQAGMKNCTVTQGYRVIGFGGARCCHKFPCSTRLAKFTVQTFLHFRHVGCVVDVFAAASYRPTSLPYRLPTRLRPRAVWIHLKLLHLDAWETYHLELLTADLQQGNVTAFEFVFPTNPPLEESEDGIFRRRMFVWRGVKVVSSFRTDVRSAVMALPQFNVIVHFRPLPLDLLIQNYTLLKEPAIVIEAPVQARSLDRTFNSGPYAGYSVCGPLHDCDQRFWGRVRDRGFGETKVQACIRFAVTSHGDPHRPRPARLEEGECREPSVSLVQCERRERALLSCDPLLHRPLLLRCLHHAIASQRTSPTHNLTGSSSHNLTGYNFTDSNLTSSSNHTHPSSNATEDVDSKSFPIRLFRSCLTFICTGNVAFCHQLGWQRGNSTRQHGNSTTSSGNYSSSADDGITWPCQHLFDPLLRESLRRGCEIVSGGVVPHRTTAGNTGGHREGEGTP